MSARRRGAGPGTVGHAGRRAHTARRPRRSRRDRIRRSRWGRTRAAVRAPGVSVGAADPAVRGAVDRGGLVPFPDKDLGQPRKRAS